MLVDTHLGPLEGAGEAARRAEESGFAGVFTGEVSSDPFLPLVPAIEATERIEVGTSIAIAFARSPMTTAYTANDLQRFSRGRFVLGLGSQVKAHVTRRFSMPWGRPAVQMREFVLAMRAAWRCWQEGAALDFAGEHYQHTLMAPNFAPRPHEFGEPLVFVAGVGDAMTRVAGEVGDGFLCHAFTTERWIREHTLPALAEGRRRAGRTMDGFTVKAAVFVATGTAEQIAAAAESVRAQIAFYASTPSYRPVLELHGWGELGAELTDLSKQGRWSEMGALVDDEVLGTFAVVAPPEQVAERVIARCAGAVDRISIIPQSPSRELIAELGI